MGVTTTKTNKPLNPRGNDQSPLAFNRAKLYSGKALDFDGVNDSVDIGQNLGFINTGDFTLLANAKFDVLSGDEPIMGQGSGSTGNAALALVNSLGKLRFAFYGDDLDWDEPIQTGKWYSLAFTFNRTTKARAIYVNGQLAVSDVTTLTPNATANTFVIGKVPYLSTYADAQITGVKAFNTALTAAQVADLYNNPEKVVPTGVDNTALKLWLPMMEGAGTTAYDGSGNGNHGTISGATYVNGVGSPVAQSAVMDWNKGTNSVLNTEDFTASTYTITAYTRTEADATAPNGLSNAARYKETAANSTRTIQFTGYTFGTSEKQVIGVFAKYDGAQYIQFAGLGLQAANEAPVFDIQNGVVHTASTSNNCESAFIEDAGNGWYKCSAVCNPTGGALFQVHGTSQIVHTADTFQGDTNDGFYLWGPFQIENEDTKRIYIPNPTGSEISSEVLLPQGLTSGRDITGVNLFENVRKQGALNLDGNSWAEVHDNESLDMTTTATMEAWVNADGLDGGYDIIMVKSSSTFWTGNYGRYTLRANEANVNWWFDDFTANSKYYTTSLSGYNHLVVTKDGTEEKLYINGALVSTQTGAATFTASPYSLVIGANSSKVEHWQSDIAQPRIYNRALTAEEVQRNYNAGKNIYTN